MRYRAFIVTMSQYVYKPVGFSPGTPIRDRSIKEKEYIIQQIRAGAYDKKYCKDKLGMVRRRERGTGSTLYYMYYLRG